jgi:AbrB family looped-hinge helix DNA binding protein
MHSGKLYGTATVGTKGQLVIPCEARDEMGIQTGDKLYVVGSPKKGFIGLLKEEQIEKYIEEATVHIEKFKLLKRHKDDTK